MNGDRRASTVQPAPRGADPFDASRIARGPDDVARYTDLPRSLVHMLRGTVERSPEAEAVVEVGGPRLSPCAASRCRATSAARC
jgi:hypothetical protein